ncbi:MAG: branched-chain amino acid transaminase [Candidatus Diapherotrites archaeon]
MPYHLEKLLILVNYKKFCNMPIVEAKKIWFNGKLVNWHDAKVHVLTHALHYGSGVFEGIRCYNTHKGPAIFRLKDHVKRLFCSAKIYSMKINFTQEQIIKAIKETVVANEFKECYIRPIVYRGYGEMGLNPLNCPVETAICCWPWGTYLGKDALKNGIKAKISSFQRIACNAFPPNAKTTGQYLNSILAKIEAIRCGCEEAIMLDSRGFISEGTGENIFIVKDSVIYTPPIHASILPGITRDTIIKFAKDLAYEVVEEDITRGMLYAADEAFVTGTAAEVTPIREVDGIQLGEPGKITKTLQKNYFDIVHGRKRRYYKWLDFVK